MYTSHGHHISGTKKLPEPDGKARCGGIAICSACSRQAGQVHTHLEKFPNAPCAEQGTINVAHFAPYNESVL